MKRIKGIELVESALLFFSFKVPVKKRKRDKKNKDK